MKHLILLLACPLLLTFAGSGKQPYEGSFSMVVGTRTSPDVAFFPGCILPFPPEYSLQLPSKVMGARVFWTKMVVPELQRSGIKKVDEEPTIVWITSKLTTAEPEIVGEFHLRIAGGNEEMLKVIAAQAGAYLRKVTRDSKPRLGTFTLQKPVSSSAFEAGR